jgi:hypothetical protein
MKHLFTAKEVGFTLEEECMVFGVATSANGAGHYMMFQVSRCPDEPDEGIYFEVDGQGKGFFGGVNDISVRPGEISIRLDSKAASKANLPEEFSVGLELSQEDSSLLKSLLMEHLHPAIPIDFHGV